MLSLGIVFWVVCGTPATAQVMSIDQYNATQREAEPRMLPPITEPAPRTRTESQRTRPTSEPPVQLRPDPRRGPRYAQCTQFDRSRPMVCNTNPALPSGRENCPTRRNTNGTLSYVCPEDRPGYAEAQRQGDFARSCGENGFACVGAYFKREYERCTYRIVPDHYPVGQFDVRVSDVQYQQRLLVYRPGEGRAHQDFESQYNRQVRYQLYNERHPNRWQDPCRAS